jgi:hypothetical protein
MTNLQKSEALILFPAACVVFKVKELLPEEKIFFFIFDSGK